MLMHSFTPHAQLSCTDTYSNASVYRCTVCLCIGQSLSCCHTSTLTCAALRPTYIQKHTHLDSHPPSHRPLHAYAHTTTPPHPGAHSYPETHPVIASCSAIAYANTLTLNIQCTSCTQPSRVPGHHCLHAPMHSCPQCPPHAKAPPSQRTPSSLVLLGPEPRGKLLTPPPPMRSGTRRWCSVRPGRALRALAPLASPHGQPRRAAGPAAL